MAALRWLTAGESHGKALVGILEGMPAGVFVAEAAFKKLLTRRLSGYGRGSRAASIERDAVEILSGIRFGRTTGSPISMAIYNKDYSKHAAAMEVFGPRPEGEKPVTAPRPGHADLAGALKYETGDIRDIRERASARETAMRCALSVPARALLSELGMTSAAFVRRIGTQEAAIPETAAVAELTALIDEVGEGFLTPDPNVVIPWTLLIDKARASGDTLGGEVEIRFEGLPAGLGSHVQADRRLDARLAAAVMGLPGVHAVEIGQAVRQSRLPGSQAHDPILWNEPRGWVRPTNLCGGLEGGMSNGSQLVLRAVMKPLPGSMPGETPSIEPSHTSVPLAADRSDTVALAALAVTAESALALELANAILERFGGDSLPQIAESMPRPNTR
ncbi:MAG TPA: chorismate synthase [Candidatus Ozemobacteraceae bacterium]|nr:chorismate synthase [Candidatus Ozemobacteraceae bacterium]